MSSNFDRLSQTQNLVLDMLQVTRNHQIPGSEEHENVVTHSSGVAILAWQLHEMLGLDLDVSKILKYGLVHDFPERGQARDTNTFATTAERIAKAERERREVAKLTAEFVHFEDLTSTIADYETKDDEESKFVWTVDKMQAIVLGRMDDWRPYKRLGITYDEFCAKKAELLARSSPYLYDIFAEIIEVGKQTYYDRPAAE